MLDFWENLVLHAALGIVQSVVKNPAKKAAVQGTLLGIANAIFEAYGTPQVSGRN